MTTPLISTILPTFEDWPFSDNVTPCAARWEEEFGSGSRIVSFRSQNWVRLRYTLEPPPPAASGPRGAQLGVAPRAVERRRHPGGVVEVSDPRRDGGDHRHTGTVAAGGDPLREQRPLVRRGLVGRLVQLP